MADKKRTTGPDVWERNARVHRVLKARRGQSYPGYAACEHARDELAAAVDAVSPGATARGDAGID